MRVCKNCDGFVPIEITFCPNCGVGVKHKKVYIPKIVSGIASLSVGITLMACYGQPPREDGDTLPLLIALTSPSNLVQVVLTAPMDLGKLTIEIGPYKFILSPEERSKSFHLYNYINSYKITDSSNKVLFEKANFNFEENCKDGVIIKTDCKMKFGDSSICYNLNGITGNLETLKCSDLNKN